jgi:hypothetical protein
VSDIEATRREPSQDVPGTAVDASKDVAHTAQHHATEIAHDARDEVGDLVAEARVQARSVVDDTRRQMREQADQQAVKVAGTMKRISRELSELADGRADQAQTVRPYLRDLARPIDDVARRLEAGRVDGLVADVQRFARRRPGAFLAIAAGAGFVAGRMARAMKDESDEGNGATTTPRESNGDAEWDRPNGPTMAVGVPQTGIGVSAATSPGLP